MKKSRFTESQVISSLKETESGVEASVGSVGDSCDNTLAEITNVLYKRPRPSHVAELGDSPAPLRGGGL